MSESERSRFLEASRCQLLQSKLCVRRQRALWMLFGVCDLHSRWLEAGHVEAQHVLMPDGEALPLDVRPRATLKTAKGQTTRTKNNKIMESCCKSGQTFDPGSMF